MSGAYTCMSCRLSLIRKFQPSQSSLWLQKAYFVTFKDRDEGIVSANSRGEARKRSPQRRDLRRKEILRSPTSEYDRRRSPLEEDFIHRLFQGRTPRGPYSVGRETQHDQPQGPNNSLIGVLKSQDTLISRNTRLKSNGPSGQKNRAVDLIGPKEQTLIRKFVEVDGASNTRSEIKFEEDVGVGRGEPLVQEPIRHSKKPTNIKTMTASMPSTHQNPSGNWRDKLEDFARFKSAVRDPKQDAVALWGTALEYWGKHPERLLDVTQLYHVFWHEDMSLRNSARLDFKLTFARFMLKITEGWCSLQIGHHGGLPKPAKLFRDLHDIHMVKKELCLDVAWILLARATERIQMNEKDSSSSSISHIVHETCEIWEIIFKLYASTKLNGESGRKAFQPQNSIIYNWRTNDFRKRVLQCFPRIANNNPSDLAALSLTTLLVVHESTSMHASENFNFPKVKDLLVFLGKLVSGSNIDAISLEWQHKHVKLHFSDRGQLFIHEKLKGVKAIAMKAHAEADAELVAAAAQSPRSPQDHRTPYGELLIKSLARALEAQNVLSAEKLWEQAQHSFGPHGSGLEAKGIPSNVYNHFLLTFFGLGRPSKAIEIWNKMTKEGKAFSLATWDAMLRGCTLARNPDGIMNIWRRMIEAGVKPDSQIWATRIYGLVVTGHWKSAIDSFEEMSQIWMNEARALHRKDEEPDWTSIGDTNDTPKPDTRTFNSLVNGLARGRKLEEIAHALSWAKTLGIKLDTYTFNPLLTMAGKSGNIVLLNELLQQMHNLGLKPDVVTFTTILDSVYRSGNEQIQADTAGAVFTEMERLGIKPNAWTFSTLVKSLLISSDNISGALAVLQYMDQHDVQIAPQIYTSFASYYFDQAEPDLAAIEALWQRAEKDAKTHLDVIFYDRMIEGYSRASKIGKATTILMHAAKRGLSPSWVAMTELLKAHGRDDDRHRMEELVANVRRDENMEDEVRSRFGRDKFWAVVRELGLDDNLGVVQHKPVGRPERRDESRSIVPAT